MKLFTLNGHLFKLAKSQNCTLNEQSVNIKALFFTALQTLKENIYFKVVL